MVRLSGYEEPQARASSPGGQRQRVALARAIVNRPRVLLLDEPLGALDLKLREQMQVELKGIQGEVGITFIYVTHDQDEALTMCDRIAVFNDGPDRAGRHAGGDLRAARRPHFVTGFVGVSNFSSATARASRSGPRRSGCSTSRMTRSRPAHRARRDPRRRLRGNGDPLPGRARCRRGASGRPPEPRDVLLGGARAARAAGDRRMATRAHGGRHGANTKGRTRSERTNAPATR